MGKLNFSYIICMNGTSLNTGPLALWYHNLSLNISLMSICSNSYSSHFLVLTTTTTTTTTTTSVHPYYIVMHSILSTFTDHIIKYVKCISNYSLLFFGDFIWCHEVNAQKQNL
jgi:hypothetical protein